MMTNETAKTAETQAIALPTRIAPALLGILFGMFLVVGAGFAGSETVHNAAHDARHAFAFPCH